MLRQILLQVTPTAMRTIGWKFYLVFISVTAVAFVWACLTIRETKGLPLEEIALLFGERDEVTVLSTNIHVDHNNHNLVVEESGDVDYSDKGLETVHASHTKAESQPAKHVEG